MKIWHISDTHGYHDLLKVEKNENIDMVIFSGDSSNNRASSINENEVINFIEWYKKLPYEYKIFVAGNHDSSIEEKLIKKDYFNKNRIFYLENESITLNHINIFGSPYTPTFNNWCFMKDRNKMNKIWELIPYNTNIVISHGPPKGILDLTYNRENELEFCGCSALMKKMLNLQPELCLFGHIHNNKSIINAGITKLSEYKTIFSNGSVLTDGKFGKLSSNGNILEL